MKRKNLLLLCVIALVAICLASCSVLENLPGSDKLPGCIELYGSHNVKHVEAKDATCTEAGNIEYWYCEACGTVWSDSANTQQITKESTVIAKTEHEYTYACDAICVHCGELTNEEAKHTIAHVEAKDATCAEPGNIEYWYCTDCGYAWADEKLTKVTNLKSVIIPELECNTVHFEAIAPGCHYNGQIEHWVCYDCERVWQDEALTQLTNIKNVVLPATGNGLLVHMDAVAPGCHDDGCIEHWICYTCEQVWADEALTQLTNIKSVTLPATGEGKLVHIEAVKPGCHYTGNVEYWTCYDCEKVWTDEALTQLSNVKNVVIPELGGDVIHVDAKAPTCYENGNIEHWYCEACGQVWADEARTQLTNHKNVILGAEHTLLVHMDAVEPGCHFTGNVEHWICYACESVWTDEALTQVSNVKNVIIPELGGDVIHVEAVEAVDCQTMGNIEHWYCETCMQVWTDEARTQLTNMMSVKLGYGEHKYFAACDPVCMLCYEVTNPDAAHNIVFVEALEATCQSMGHIAHYKCTHCNTCWDNELGQGMPINRMIYTFAECTPEYACESKCKWCFADVETEGHKIVAVRAVASTCTKNGNVAHYTCEHCGKLWDDKELTKTLSKNEITLPLIPHEYRYECDAHCMNCYELTNEYASHNIEFVEAKDPTCIAFGNIEHYACTYCAGCWDNAEGLGAPLNKMMVNISKVDHEALSPCYPECKWCFRPIFEDNAHNVVKVEAKDKTCLLAGNIEHWTCTQCNTIWADEALTTTLRLADVMIPTKGEHTYDFECDSVCVVCLLESRPERTHEYFNKCDKVCMYCYEVTNPTADHTVEHVEAVDPVCHQTGNVEYWYCTDCGIAWADETLRYQTNLKSVITPALVGLTYVAEVPATCHQLGCQEYWYCTDCKAVFADAEGRYLTNVKNLTLVYTADITHVDAVEATCHQNGNVEYWYCNDCLAVFTDAALTQLSNFKSVVTPATVGLTYVAEVEAACHQNGRQEYWYCEECKAIFSDAQGRYLTNYLNLTIPYTAELVHVEAVEGTDCVTYDGNIEYWYCAECETVFTDAALTQVSNFQSVKVNGSHSYFYACDAVCQVCNEVTKEVTHDIVHVDAKAATCTVNGNIEYWYCSICGSAWADEDLTQVTNRMSVVVPAPGHNYVKGYCTNCGGKDPEATFALGVVDTPVVGVPYKFGMYQAKVGNTYYITGAMSGYYMATTTDASKSVDVYLEETTGGYYLYCYVSGAKKYINMVVSGTHVNGAFEATAKTVYTYNAEKQILVSVVNGEDYCFGTRNDKTYTTVGPVKVSYNGFWNKLSDYIVYVCPHENTTTETVEADCTNKGSKTVTCDDCGNVVSTTVIPANGHTYENGACVYCGEAESSVEIVETTVTVDFTQQGYANQTGFTGMTVDEVISLVAAANGNNNSPKYYTSGTAIRFYCKNSLTISAEDGYKIKSIIINSGSSNGSYVIKDSNAIITNATASGLGSKTVTLTPVDGTSDVVLQYNPSVTSGNFRIASITIVYENVG